MDPLHALFFLAAFFLAASLLGTVAFFRSGSAAKEARELSNEVVVLRRTVGMLETEIQRISQRLGRPDDEGIPEEEPSTPPEAAEAYVFRSDQLEHYGASQLRTLEEVLAVREEGLTIDRLRRHRRDLVEIAARIRGKIGYEDAVPESEVPLFLAAFARAQRRHLEERQQLDTAPEPAVERAAGPSPAEPTQAPEKHALEKTLASRWMVWLGAAAVALSAVFLFSYAVEQDWLGPIPRVLLGVLLGLGLIFAGEWMHRHPVAPIGRVGGADFVPPALTSSGLFALFVTVFAAHALYGLVPAWLAFLALGAVSFAALALALRQGWFVALLGLVGGYAVPALLESGTSNALPVFLYVFAVTAGCLALMVWRKWWWLSFATFLGALAWPVLWLAGPWTPADQGVLGTYAVALACLFALLSVGLPVKRPGTPATAWLASVLADTSGLGFALSGALVVLLAVAHDFNEAAFVFLGLYAIAGLSLGLRRAAFESLAVVGGLITALAFLLWPPPAAISAPEELARMGVDSYRTAFGPYIMPPEFVLFARSLLAFAAIFGIGGFLALRRAGTPAVWSALSAAMPLFLLVVGYWRIAAFEVDVRWAALAFGLAILNLAAAAMVPRIIGDRDRDVPLSFYAASCTAALALAFTCLLREAWLTVAISLEVVALAWLWTQLKVGELRLIGFAAVAVVIIRLVLNYEIVGYEGSVAGLFSWVIYGYGIPAVAFFYAARLFREDASDPLARLCEVAGAAVAFLMVVLQLRIWTAGAIDAPRYDLFDQAVQSVWWLIAAGLLLRRELDERAPWAWFGGLILLGLAALQIVFGQVIANNPILADEPVGALPVLNLLGLAYLLPAVMFWILAADRGFELTPELRQILRILAAALLFVYVTLEVRHLFWGSAMQLTLSTEPTNSEVYAYSLAWIIFALSLLAFGIVRQASFWRYSSMAVLVVTVLKVFLYDMSDLSGLYRVASFLGLGLALIGIGHIYRRFVFAN